MKNALLILITLPLMTIANEKPLHGKQVIFEGETLDIAKLSIRTKKHESIIFNCVKTTASSISPTSPAQCNAVEPLLVRHEQKRIDSEVNFSQIISRGKIFEDTGHYHFDAIRHMNENFLDSEIEFYMNKRLNVNGRDQTVFLAYNDETYLPNLFSVSSIPAKAVGFSGGIIPAVIAGIPLFVALIPIDIVLLPAKLINGMIVKSKDKKRKTEYLGTIKLNKKKYSQAIEILGL